MTAPQNAAGKLIAHSQNRFGTKQTLSQHSKNVAAKLSSILEPVGLEALGSFVGLLHDLGKAQDGWQAYIENLTDLGKAHPSHASLGRIVLDKQMFPAIDDNILESEYRYLLVQVIRGHHTSIHDDIDLDDDDYNYEKIVSEELDENINVDRDLLSRFCGDLEISTKELRDMFERGYEEYKEVVFEIQGRNERYRGKLATEAIAVEKNFLIALVLSALMDADWLDTQRHEDGISSVHKEKKPDWKRLGDNLEKTVSGFSSEGQLNAIRKEISDACFAAGQVDPRFGSYRLSVFCGGGKTISSARYAIRHAGKWNKPHVYYVIPFTSIIEQNADVLREATGASDKDLLEHHCNAGIDYTLPADEVLKAKTAQRSVRRYEEPIVFLTQVRFLESAFGKEKKNRRLFSQFIDSEIIFDEFQATPIKCLDLFYLLADFMVHVMKCNVVLCSATQAAHADYGLTESAFLTGVDWNAKYGTALGRTVFEDRTTFGDRPIKTDGELISLLDDLATQGKSSLVIVNTKKQARHLYQKVVAAFPEKEVIHLSTNMFPQHRRQAIADLKVFLKEGQAPICISTTLIEAGVDVSFDSVIRYIGGFDNIVQGAGRCNRENEKDEAATVYIVNEPQPTQMIRKQRNATAKVLQSYSGELDESMLDALDSYYAAYLRNIGKNETRYPVGTGDSRNNTSLVDWWGLNDPYRNDPSRFNQPWEDPETTREAPKHCSMVRSAQATFEVIESYGQDVVVAANDDVLGYIEQYENAETWQEALRIQSYLQGYCVTLSKKDYDEIESGIEQIDNQNINSSVLVLKEGLYYDPKCGVMPQSENDYIY